MIPAVFLLRFVFNVSDNCCYRSRGLYDADYYVQYHFEKNVTLEWRVFLVVWLLAPFS